MVMLAKDTTKKKSIKFKADDTTDHAETLSKQLPPFIKHFKHKVNGNDVKDKVGDTKQWKGDTWHFCDCTNHRDRIKWHTHPATDCRTRKRWLKQKKIKPEAQANLGRDEQEDQDITSESDNDETYVVVDNNNIQALLAACMNSVQDNPLARDTIADALGHFNTWLLQWSQYFCKFKKLHLNQLRD